MRVPSTRIWLPVIVCAILAAAQSVCVPSASDSSGALLQGAQWIAAGNYAEAEASFSEAAREDALCAVARVGQGAALLFQQRPDEAAVAFDSAVAIDPHCVSGVLGKGAALYSLGRIQDAMSSYRQTLGYETACSPQIRAAVAELACMEGFYRAAELEATSALKAEPSCELAIQVLASSYIAQGRPAAAIKALTAPVRDVTTAYPGLTARSPLFAPGVAYYIDHGLDDSLRLAGLTDFGIRPTQTVAQAIGETGDVPENDATGLRIDWPRAGSRVSGGVEVSVTVPDDLKVDYIALLLDDRFVGVSNSTPYRVYIDTTGCGDGLRQIRCQAYGESERVLASCAVTVTVVNGARTVAASELAARAEIERFLQECLLIQPEPVFRAQLCGYALQMAGRTEEALDAFEYGFSYNPRLPGLRADLLLAYHDLGLLTDHPQEIHRLPAGGRRVALTFDDGPHPVLTPVILDLLDRYNAKATFLLVGKQAETYPELVREIVARGHEVGAHSYSHRNLTTLSGLEVERELVMTRQVIRRASGQFTTLFRPPGGHYNATVRNAAQATGFTTVFWQENIGAYSDVSGAEGAARMLQKIHESNIVLLHSGYDATPELLPYLLPELQKQGYRMDTISSMTPHEPFVLPGIAAANSPGWKLN